MNILGISAFYHDSAACLVSDGEIISAAQEERFTRIKHDSSFPVNAINFCLKFSKLKISDIDYIAFYDKPFIKFERIMETYLTYSPGGIRSFVKAVPLWIKQKLWLKDIIQKELNYTGKIIFPEHHESHAASAFYPSPFQDAAFITIDGVGEWTTTSYGIGSGNDLKILSELRYPHSLGLLYSAFTYYLGFKVNSDEYKVMGLAPYGNPVYKDKILNELIDLKDDGSFRLNMKYFNYNVGLTMTNKKFNKLFNGAPRVPETKITEREMDIARSIQDVTDEIMIRIAGHVKKETGSENLCLAGGVALNCVANGKIYREKIFKRIWVQPAAGDAGGALGAALFAWYKVLQNQRNVDYVHDSQKCSLLGPSFTDDYIIKFLKKNKIPFKTLNEKNIPETVASLLAKGNIIGWFQGRMEFGPRALGSRSILGNPQMPSMQKTMNFKIKFREGFRPFAPSILKEYISKYFYFDDESPYMLFVADVKNGFRKPLKKSEKTLQGLGKLKVVRSSIPAVTHVDYSARFQTVDKDDNPLYYNMIKQFYKKTECPLIVNTSFNQRGEPIVCSPEDAYNCFMFTGIDYVLLGNYLLSKKDQQLIDDVEFIK